MPTEELFGSYSFVFDSKRDAGASVRDGTSNTVLLAEDHVPTSTDGTRDHDHAGAYSFAVEIDGITATGIATHTDWHLV